MGFRANLKGKRAGVNYRFIFMKPQGDELAQIAILVAKGMIKPVVGFFPFLSVKLPSSIVHREEPEERSLLA